MRKISIAVTTYNRPNTVRAFEKVLNDERIDDIVVVDDCSNLQSFRKLKENIISLNQKQKIRLFRNNKNLDCYRNKRRAVSLADNESVIVLDSDNVIDKSYLDAIDNWGFNELAVAQPSFAKPHFDFRALAGKVITRENVAEYLMQIPVTEVMLNAMNFLVNKHAFLAFSDEGVDPVTSDSLFWNANFLRNGGEIHVIEDMHYDHPISEDSHYKLNNRRTPRDLHEKIMNELRGMR